MAFGRIGVEVLRNRPYGPEYGVSSNGTDNRLTPSDRRGDRLGKAFLAHTSGLGNVGFTASACADFGETLFSTHHGAARPDCRAICAGYKALLREPQAG